MTMDTHAVCIATDLDGTFLGGPDAERARLYSLIESAREHIGLIFVSGRDLPFIASLCTETDVPWPDFVIGDVGTTIARVHEAHGDDGEAIRRIAPLEVLETHIANIWNDSGERVRAHLDGAAGLRLQETPFRYRVSYHYDPDAYDASVEAGIEAMGLDVLISDRRFLDVLPRGVNKGASLLRLIDHLGIDAERVLVAGDTLNDLSLFQTGLKGVAVGNSEPALVERLDGVTTTYRAEAFGAAGILEALNYFNLLAHTGDT
jgi:HAD superfamily hydrolase (TIGR01484 family)